jgi:hypothetical protein
MIGLVLMTSPFQHVLGLIPKGVLAGLFVCPLLFTLSEKEKLIESGTWEQTPFLQVE